MSVISPVFVQARSRRAGIDYVLALLGPMGGVRWQLAGHASPRRLQAPLTEYVWDARVLAERVQALLVNALADSDVVLAVDGTTRLKAGDQAVGWRRSTPGSPGRWRLPDCGVRRVCDRSGARVNGLPVGPAQGVDRRCRPAAARSGPVRARRVT